MMLDHTWRIRSYQDGDEDAIRALFQNAFGEVLGAERWNWQYRDHYTGLMMSLVAVNKEDEIVGHYAARPVRMKVSDEVHIGMLAVDAMVRSDYQRQGMFVQLGKSLHRFAAEQGVPLLYAFPQETSSHAFYTKLGWAKLYNRVPLYVKVLDVAGVLRSRLGGRFLSSVLAPAGTAALGLLDRFIGGKLPDGCRLVEVARFDERLDALWAQASVRHNILLVRDQAYLNWRFADSPTECYTCLVVEKASEVVGYAVLKQEQRFGLHVGYIMDILTIPTEPALAAGLIAQVIDRFRHQQLEMVGCLMLEHTSYAHALRKNGFIRVPDRLYPQVLTLGVYCSSEHHSDQFLLDPGNWFVTFGDHDYV
jgi:predicted N-acetyltransferase YhbS